MTVVDAQGRQFAENALLANMIPLEMAHAIEHWNFDGDAVNVVLKEARRCRCRTMHFWFVNRDGATRCVDCDAAHLRDRAEKQLAEVTAA